MARIIKRRVEWEYVVTEDVASFNVYYAPGDNVELNYENEFINVPADMAVSVYSITLPDAIPALENQKAAYTFAITAVDVNGNESDMSPRVTRFFTFTPPAAPTVVRIV